MTLSDELLVMLKRSIHGHRFWEKYLEPLGAAGPNPFSVHLAVLLEPYLSYILEGSKTVESRFSKNRIAPYNMVRSGDVVLLKRAAARSISGICLVNNVWFYRLDPATWTVIRSRFASSLRADDASFWEQRKAARFASLMRISETYALPPFEVRKRDRRGWVILNPVSQPSLDISEGSPQ